MHEPHQSLESLCFNYTKRIAATAASPFLATVPHIESEVNEAVTHLIRLQVGAPKGNLKVLAVQLEFAKGSLAKDEQTRRLIGHARSIVEEKIQQLALSSPPTEKFPPSGPSLYC